MRLNGIKVYKRYHIIARSRRKRIAVRRNPKRRPVASRKPRLRQKTARSVLSASLSVATRDAKNALTTTTARKTVRNKEKTYSHALPKV